MVRKYATTLTTLSIGGTLFKCKQHAICDLRGPQSLTTQLCSKGRHLTQQEVTSGRVEFPAKKFYFRF